MKPNKAAPNWLRLVWFGLLVLVALLMLWALVIRPIISRDGLELSSTQLYAAMEEGKVQKLELALESGIVTGTYSHGGKFHSRVADIAGLEKEARARGAQVEVVSPSIFRNWVFWMILSGVVLVIGELIFFVWLIRRDRREALKNSKAKLVTKRPAERFVDVGGCEEAIEELQEILDMFANPERYKKKGVRVPRGVLLIGPPGVGKTLIAKAFAGECGINFLEQSGSDFEEYFVGAGASKVRAMFKVARENAPCVVFIDEADVLLKKRLGSAMTGGEQEYIQTTSSFLSEVDGFHSDEKVIILAATNRPEAFDPAALRPGRFDRKVCVDRPDVRARKKILEIHTGDKPLHEDVDLEAVAKATTMFTGADLAAVANEAAAFSAKRPDDPYVRKKDFDEAIEKVLLGPGKRHLVISEKDKRNSAYHEAGHTLVAKLLPDADRPRKVSILPRGPAGGVTWLAPAEERALETRNQLLAQLTVAMGGRVAEIIGCHEETGGPCGDFNNVTEVTRKMICRYGMSELVGKLTFSQSSQFLGMGFESLGDCSPTTKRLIEMEMKRLADEAYSRAFKLIAEEPVNQKRLHLLAAALLKEETLDEKRIDEIVNSVQAPA